MGPVRLTTDTYVPRHDRAVILTIEHLDPRAFSASSRFRARAEFVKVSETSGC